MRENVDKLDIYNNSAIILEKKTPNFILSWITILIISTILFVIFSFIPFNIYKPYVGYINIENDTLFVKSKVESSDFPVIKGKKLYIKGVRYNYEVVSIEDDILTIKLEDDNLKIQNNIIMFNILKNRTTLFKIIIAKLKERIG